MCGITGILRARSGQEVDAALLGRMNESLRHRGPNAAGSHIAPGVGLAHRRLSIIDLSGGAQPLRSDDGRLVLVFNGEIYNFPALRAELLALGHGFHSRCDTEVLLHAWRQWGEDCIGRLRGMFAFAIWDQQRKSLFLARDRLGEKPLYHATLPNGDFLFGSELKALLVHPDLPRSLDHQAVEDYFAFGHVPEPRTILQHVRKLPPGHTLQVRDHATRAARVCQYWDVPMADPADMPTAGLGAGMSANPSVRTGQSVQSDDRLAGELAEELTRRLRQSVDMCMLADVPLGAFLSGGVDSSAVVATMAGLSDQPVRTCAMAFDDPEFNEADQAARVARLFATDHHSEQVSVNDAGLLDTLAGVYDEPFADSSAIPTYRLCELTRKRVTVALSGDGGDEVFAGYPWYQGHMRMARLRRMVPDAVRPSLFRTLASLYPSSSRLPRAMRLGGSLAKMAMNTADSFSLSTMMTDPATRRMLYGRQMSRDLQGYEALEVIRGHADRAPSDHPLSLAQYIDMKVYLPSDILTKVDRASMAHSLEVRIPLLDHTLVEWAGTRVPPEMKLAGNESKDLLKRAFEPTLPRDILYRRKMGFSVPIARWFRGPLQHRVNQLPDSEHLTGPGLMHGPALRRLLDIHQSGRADHSATIWQLLMFEACSKRLFG